MERQTSTQTSVKTPVYYPGSGDDWERRTPEEVGIDSGLLQQAIDYSNDPAHEGYPPDLGKHLAATTGAKQYDDGVILGPTKERGAITGIVLRHGYLVKEWGEPERVDMTFSVTKSFLSTVAGLAYDRGLIRDIHDRVKDYVDDGGYDSPHNARITWDHSLRQISEWDGTLWDKHYSAANPNDVLRPVEEPGTVYEYNDVRVNRLALSVLRVWKKALPEVLKDGESGFLVKVGDVDAMADRAVKLLTDDALHRSVSEAARSRVVDTFSEERVAPRYEAYYRRVIEGDTSPRIPGKARAAARPAAAVRAK